MRHKRYRLRPVQEKLRVFVGDERAISITEYGLLISLIAVAVLAAVYLFGTAITSWFGSKTGQITSY
jgi:Flp pilus assembly pilin Flp